MEETKICPKCKQEQEKPLNYSNALSRTDNKTIICDECGSVEAIEDMWGNLTPQSEW